MAVLHLLLTGNASARALPGLQSVVDKHSAVLDRKLFAVDYHLLGKESFEAALFQGYLDAVARRHPEAPLPVLHESGRLFEDAEGLRRRLGDEAFFASLNTDAPAAAGWGKRAAAWTPESYAAAAAAPVGDPQHDRLVATLVKEHFSSFGSAGDWLEIARGLRVMTQHARDLGYDGIVLFLDELVLWLAQHLGDSQFIADETSKVAKLVETEMDVLPVPIVSFVARQRDLKDFLGGGTAPGAEQAALGQSFRWWEDRFERITLRAADLPQIVNKRLLTPVSPEAAEQVRDAVARVKADSASWNVLLTSADKASGADFSLTYPFSPALVDAMVALSSLLQRERTALLLMGELLSLGRDTLTINDVIPVGDLFDVTVLGNTQPLTTEMRQHFDNARKFYLQRMRPHLLAKHQLSDAEARKLPRDHAFVTEDRLAKTLLVAALAPGAPSLANLNAAKLAALNYGTVASFIPGQQAQQVLTYVRSWAAEFGEVHVGDGPDPSISLVLTGVDHEAVLEQVQNEDTEANRKALVRKLLTSELGIPEQTSLLAKWTFSLVWRGTKREIDVVFGNIRDDTELPNEALTNPEGWRLVIDMPWDVGTYSAQDDVNRIALLRAGGADATTIAWVPHFLTADRMNDVGRLCMLEYLLDGRFDNYSGILNPGDREPARMQLENQRNSLRRKVLGVLREAYGVTPASPDNVDVGIKETEVFSTLKQGLHITRPVQPSFRATLEDTVRQALDFEFPEHPKFEPGDKEVRRAELTTTLEAVRAALESSGRIEDLDKPRAAVVARVAHALQLGQVRENVYALRSDNFGWLQHFTRWNASDAQQGTVTVAALRKRLGAYGMPDEVQDLLILTWAALEDREWLRAGTPVPPPAIGQVHSDMGLRPARLPSESEWESALAAAQALFGAPRPPRRSAAGVNRLASAVRTKVHELRPPVAQLRAELESHAALLGLDTQQNDRWTTTVKAHEVLEALAKESDDTLLLQVLALVELPNEPQPLARAMTSAPELVRALKSTDWSILDKIAGVPGGQGEEILSGLREVARRAELHAPLAPALAEARARAVEVLITLAPTPAPATPTPAPQPVPTPEPAVPAPGPATPTDPDEVFLDIDDLESQLLDLRKKWQAALRSGKRLRVRWWVE
ncbi:MAG: hypothetical protein GX593_00485 [Actinomycetales bacterium]|nr:hypothetical protein [Actinomycetales bacterium]